MKIKHRIFSIIIAVGTAVQITAAAEAANTDMQIPQYGEKAYGQLQLLANMGYIDSIEMMNPNAAVRRDQFADWLCITANMKERQYFYKTDFEDLSESNMYYNEIQIAVSEGYMSGVSAESFSPEANISRQDAAAALVRLAGYDAYAMAKGGYPTGYICVAQNMGIFDGAGVEANTMNLLTMLYNTLNSVYLNPVGIDGQNISYSRNEKIIEHFHDIYEIKGRMSANGYTKLYSDSVIANRSTCEIDKTVYNTDDDYNSLIGMTVRGYYKYNATEDENSIVCLYADNRDNRELEIEAEDLVRLDDNYRLYYTDENERTKNIRLLKGFDFIYNNRIVLDYTGEDIFIDDGTLRFVDSDADGVYDTVLVREAETMRMTSVDFYSMRIYCEEDVLETAGIADAYAVYKVQDETGGLNEVSIDELEPKQVLTVYRSKDRIYLEVLASSLAASGSVQEVDEDYAVLSGKKYKVVRNELLAELKIGSDADVLLDIYGRIAYIDAIGGTYSFKYAYLFKTWYDEELDTAGIRIITQDGRLNLCADDKIMIDGETAKQSAVLALDRQMIRYRLNKKGMVRAIDTVRTVCGGDADTLKSTARDKLKLYPLSQIIAAKYKITSDTFMIVVPTVASEKEDIELYQTSYEYDTEPNNYEFEIFDIDKDDMSIGAYIMYPEGSLVGQEKTDGGTAIGVVKNISERWIDDEAVDAVTLFTSAGYVTYAIDTVLTNRNYSFGDVVRYKVNAKGKISTMEKELDTDADDVYSTKQLYTTEGYYDFNFGRLLSKQDGYLVMLSNENNPNYQDTVDSRRVIYTSKMTSCWLVDMSERKITRIEPENYASYIRGASSPSYAYARTYKYYNLPNLIIYRY